MSYMNRTQIVCIAMVMALLSLPALGTLKDFNPTTDNLNSKYVEESPLLPDLTSNTANRNDLEYFDKYKETLGQGGKRILLVKSNEIASDADKKIVKDAVKSGIPVIFTGDLKIPVSLGLFTAFSPESSYSALYYNKIINTTYSFSTDAGTDEENAVINWANYIVDREITGSTQANVGEVFVVQQTKSCNGASFNVSTIYEKIAVSNGQHFFKVHYGLQSCPTNNKRTTDMTVYCNVIKHNSLMNLISYGPTTTSGSSTYGASVNLNAGTSGVGAGVSLSWAYSIADVNVYDQSNFAQDLVKIWHEVNPERPVGFSTYLVNPGSVITVQNNSVLHAEDEYSVKFRTPYTQHFWPWDPYYIYTNYTLSTNLYIIP